MPVVVNIIENGVVVDTALVALDATPEEIDELINSMLDSIEGVSNV